jgi:hypothetical protein
MRPERLLQIRRRVITRIEPLVPESFKVKTVHKVLS